MASLLKTLAFPLGVIGVSVLGFVTPFVVSISPADQVGILFFSFIITPTGLSFYKYFNKVLFWFALFLAVPFPILMVFSTHESGALSVLWLIPFWLPIILMCLLKLARESLASEIGGWMGILGVFVCFLGLGIVSGVNHNEKMMEFFGITITGTHVFLMFVAIFSVLALWFLADILQKRRKNLQVCARASHGRYLKGK